MARGGKRTGLERHVNERFAREADAVKHVVDHKSGEQADGEGADVGKRDSDGIREVIPKFAEGGGHGGEVI